MTKEWDWMELNPDDPRRAAKILAYIEAGAGMGLGKVEWETIKACLRARSLMSDTGTAHEPEACDHPVLRDDSEQPKRDIYVCSGCGTKFHLDQYRLEPTSRGAVLLKHAKGCGCPTCADGITRSDIEQGASRDASSDPRPIAPWDRKELMPYMSLGEVSRKYEEAKYERELAAWNERHSTRTLEQS